MAIMSALVKMIVQVHYAEIAKKALKRGFSPKQISRFSDLDEPTICKLQNEVDCAPTKLEIYLSKISQDAVKLREIEIAKNMLNNGMHTAIVSRDIGLDEAIVLELKESIYEPFSGTFCGMSMKFLGETVYELTHFVDMRTAKKMLSVGIDMADIQYVIGLDEATILKLQTELNAA